jgi:phosphatidylglycerol:prolipoprotein diacylglycerol transferase
MSSAPRTGRLERDNHGQSSRPTAPSAAAVPLRGALRGARLRGSESLQVSSPLKVIDELQPHALGVTYWVDTPDVAEPFSVKVRFIGRRIGLKGKPRSHDSFNVVETVADLVPGSGPIAVTRRVSGIAAGRWHVTAAAHQFDPTNPAKAAKKLPGASSTGSTGYAPVIQIRAPGAILGAWPALVGLGAVVALVTQFALARRAGLPAGQILLVSTLANVIGLAGAKLYYAVEHRGQGKSLLIAGMCIQGFVVSAIGALAAGSAMIGLPIGAVLDVTAPGLLFGMAVGRIGCFLGGCCAGRATNSSCGLWSSDRHLGFRRFPTQLLESTLALCIGLAALATLTPAVDHESGALFVAALAAYVFGRQLLFPLRSLARNTRHGRAATMLLSAIVVIIAIYATLAR